MPRGHLSVQISINIGDFVKTFKPQRTDLGVTGQGLGSREQENKEHYYLSNIMVAVNRNRILLINTISQDLRTTLLNSKIYNEFKF